MFVKLIDSMGTDLSVVNAARVSFGKRKEEFTEGDKFLIKYLAEHGHWSPFAHCSAQFHIKAPVFVARQLVKHQVGLSWNEIPEIKSKINMGCYVMEPTTLNFIPKNKTYGMDDVIKKAISKRKTVNSILIKKGFVDVGDKKTYEKLRLEHKKRGKI